MQKIKIGRVFTIVPFLLMIIMSEISVAKNTFPQIESISNDQATKNLLGETGDLGMIYQHMKAGNWSNAEEMLTNFKAKIKSEPSSYPEEPSHQKVESVVRALDIEISKFVKNENAEKNPSAKSCDDKAIEQCKKDYKTENRDGSFSGSFSIAESGINLEAYKDATTVMSFFNDCNCSNFSKEERESIGQYIVDNKSDYVERYKKLEIRYKSIKSAEKTCSDFKICHKKMEESEALSSWPKNTIEELRSSEADMKNPENLRSEGFVSNTNTMVGFGKVCPCFVKEMGLLPHVELANSFIKKWDKEEKDNQLHLAELKKKQDVEVKEQAKIQEQEAAKRLIIKQAADKKYSSHECKVTMAKSDYCGAMLRVRINERIISREKEIGKQSGFVNAGKLNSAVEIKISMEDVASKAQKKYQLESGKSLSRADCNITDEEYPYARLPASFNQEREQNCGSDN